MGEAVELTQANCLQQADAKAAALNEATFDRNRILNRSRRGQRAWIERMPFFMALSLKGGLDGSVKTWWLSKNDSVSMFTDFGLVGTWTPIGRIALAVKNDIKDGRQPGRYVVSRRRWANVVSSHE